MSEDPEGCDGDLDLAELIAFFDNPARAFLRGRLGVGLPLEDEPPSDAIPIELDNLEHWAVGDRALAELLAGRSPSQIVDAERLRGTLPPRELGTAVLNDVGPIGEAIAGATAAVRREIGAPSGDPVRAVDVALDLPDGRRLTGTVGQVLGRTHLVTTYSTQRAKQRLHLWIALLALTAGEPRVRDDLRGADRLGRNPPKQAPHEGRLPRADLSRHDNEALDLMKPVLEVGHRAPVASASEEEVGIRIELERLTRQPEECFVHDQNVALKDAITAFSS